MDEVVTTKEGKKYIQQEIHAYNFEIINEMELDEFISKKLEYNLNEIIKYISSFSYEDRIRILKLKPDRADVIIPSGEIYKMVMSSTGANQIIVPKVGLSDGIIYNLFLQKEL